MKGCSRFLILALLLLAHGSSSVQAMEPIRTKLLAAMPILQRSITQLIVGTVSNDFHLSVSRAVLPRVVVRAEASTAEQFELNVRFLALLQVAPAFLAVEIGPKRVTGFMTLFFGPVSIDLGRSWFEPLRWALAQLIVHPRLTMVVGGIQQPEGIVPVAGWRLFPAASAQWEIGMLFTGSEIRLSVGGIL